MLSWSLKWFKDRHVCCIFRTALAPNPDWNLNFQPFCVKKLKKCKKVTNLLQNLAKKCFLSLHQNAGRMLKKGNKNFNRRFGANLKTLFFLLNFAPKLLLFCIFWLSCTKNAENEVFNQHLVCKAPKRWSKYTIHVRSKS